MLKRTTFGGVGRRASARAQIPALTTSTHTNAILCMKKHYSEFGERAGVEHKREQDGSGQVHVSKTPENTAIFRVAG